MFRRAALCLLLIGAVYWCGMSALDSPWQHGDERIFIATNPDVIGGGPQSLLERCAQIFLHVHDDLYQPIPILSFALEWAAFGDQPMQFRRNDVLLHALNALLVWAVLAALLQRLNLAHDWSAAQRDLLCFLLAAIWALHPVQVSIYAADMGRTHLLATAFALGSLLAHLKSLQPGGGRWFALALLLLLLAMLSKALAGWVLLVFALEAALLGARRAFASPRVWIVGVLCVFFAGLTIWTSRESGMIEDVSRALFGDPLTRSALAFWIYTRSLVAPLALSPWYLPDPRTAWTHTPVLLGAALAIATLLHAAWAWRTPQTRGASIGWAWFWATLLPVIGLVGARQAAAVDRYLYQPLIGLLLVGLVLLTRVLQPAQPRATRLVACTAATTLLCGIYLWINPPNVQMYRSSILRAQRILELNPSDPRALEAMAAAFDFARGHPIPRGELPPMREDLDPRAQQFVHFNQKMIAALLSAAQTQDASAYFRGAADRAAFHRRLAFRLLMADQPQPSLQQAETARELEPDSPSTWQRLAHAYRRVNRLEDALAAFERREALLAAQRPLSDPRNRQLWAVHLTDVGDLLLALNRPADALRKLQQAIQTGAAPPRATLLLARCEIRGGKGAEGFRLLSEYMRVNPHDPDAQLAVGEYHIRSHHWKDALDTYSSLLQRAPAHYEALRGYFEACVHTSRWKEAVAAWARALQSAPQDRAIQSFLCWALACASDPNAAAAADALLTDDPDNPLACFAKMLLAIRGDDLQEALRWVERAQRGAPIPHARAPERVAGALQAMAAHGELQSEALLAAAAIWASIDEAPRARALLNELLAQDLDPATRSLVSRWAEKVP